MEKIDFKKQNIPFTMVANGILNDSNLSFNAKGLYAYLYSKPDGWYFSSIRISQDSKDGKKHVRTGLKELEDTGYLFRQKLPSGRFLYKLIYPPIKPESTIGTLGEKPESTKATVPKSHSAESGLISNKEYKQEREESNTIAAVTAGEFSLEAEIQKLKESPRRDLKIIGWFIKEKGISLKSKEQLGVTIKRHLRAAKLISPFSKQQIDSIVDQADRAIGNKWTLETLYKLLTK